MFKRHPSHSKVFKEFSTSHKLSSCQWLSIIARLYASFKYIRSLEAPSPWGLKACPPPLLTFLKLPGIYEQLSFIFACLYILTNDRNFNWTWVTIYLICICWHSPSKGNSLAITMQVCIHQKKTKHFISLTPFLTKKPGSTLVWGT